METLPLTPEQSAALLLAARTQMQAVGADVCVITFFDTPTGSYRIHIDVARGITSFHRLTWLERLRDRWDEWVERHTVP